MGAYVTSLLAIGAINQEWRLIAKATHFHLDSRKLHARKVLRPLEIDPFYTDQGGIMTVTEALDCVMDIGSNREQAVAWLTSLPEQVRYIVVELSPYD